MQTVGGYEILGELGRGGAGTVYLARQVSLDRRVAMKVLSTSDQGMADRLLAEAKVLAELRDPNIVSVIDFGELDGQPWYTMTYCGGGTLAGVLDRDGALSPAQAAAVGAAVSSALATLHARGIVHRDVKPGNILLTDDGSVLLGDLGTALDAKAERVTTTGAVLGTMGYTAPELISGEAPTSASDVFSLGVVMYEMLAGQRPFRGGHIAAVIDAIRSGRYEPLETAAPDTPPEMQELVGRALDPDPAKRPADLRSWGAALAAVAAPAAIRPAPPAEAERAPTMMVSSGRLRTPAPNTVPVVADRDDRKRRKGFVVLAGAVAALALVVGGVFAFGRGGDQGNLVASPGDSVRTSVGASATTAASTVAPTTDLATTTVAGDSVPATTLGVGETTIATPAAGEPDPATAAPPPPSPGSGGKSSGGVAVDSCPSGDKSGSTTDGKCAAPPVLPTPDQCPGGDKSGSTTDGKCDAQSPTPVKDSCPSGDKSGNEYDGKCLPNPPAPPASVSASATSHTSGSASWGGSSTPGVSYRVSLNGTVTGTFSGLSTSFSGLAASTSYTVSVVAIDVHGQASSARTASFVTASAPTTTALPPPPPPPNAAPVGGNKATGRKLTAANNTPPLCWSYDFLQGAYDPNGDPFTGVVVGSSGGWGGATNYTFSAPGTLNICATYNAISFLNPSATSRSFTVSFVITDSKGASSPTYTVTVTISK